MKQEIFFDIDRTLFRTNDWYESNRRSITGLFSDKYLMDGTQCYDLYFKLLKGRSQSSNSNVKETILELSDILSLDNKKLESDINEIFEKEDYQSLIYDGVYELLADLRKTFFIGIFSEGDPWLQSMKVGKSELHKYFEESRIFFLQNKLQNLDKLPYGCFYFDDSEGIIDAIKSQRKDIHATRVDEKNGIATFSFDEISQMLNCR